MQSNIKVYKCEICGVSEWNDKPIRLQLHHINGNNKDNRLENLQLLCPNCHSQTETYARGNHKENIIKTNINYDELDKYVVINKTKKCAYCGKLFKPVKKNMKYCCIKCSHNAMKAYEPTKEELIEKFKEKMSFSGVSRDYNVSDNTIRKWFKKFNLPTHTKEMRQIIKNN